MELFWLVAVQLCRGVELLGQHVTQSRGYINHEIKVAIGWVGLAGGQREILQTMRVTRTDTEVALCVGPLTGLPLLPLGTKRRSLPYLSPLFLGKYQKNVRCVVQPLLYIIPFQSIASLVLPFWEFVDRVKFLEYEGELGVVGREAGGG